MQKSVLVFGLGVSGMAAAGLLRSLGYAVTVSDAGDTDELRRRAAELDSAGCIVRLGAPAVPMGDFELCVVSPGLSADSPWVREVSARGIDVVPEIEFGRRYLRARILAVTGSNGKSTLVKLCVDGLCRAGYRACPAGNYGVPASQVVLDGRDWDWVVLEVSSFQLELARRFRPHVGVLLNIQPNHLDRHGDFAAYRRVKSQIFAAMRPDDIGIAEAGLAAAPDIWTGPNRRITFGVASPADFRYQLGVIIGPDGNPVADITGTHFDNPVYGMSAAAAAAAMAGCGVAGDCLAEAVRDFQPLPHRLEDIAKPGEYRGVRFVNDSKSTNLAALIAALRILPPPIRLIAGGRGKGESFAPARTELKGKVVGAYLIGREAPAMAAAWRDTVACRECGTLAQACAAAWADAVPGDTILLSPGCAGFDQFRDFAARGEAFRKLVAGIRPRSGGSGKW